MQYILFVAIGVALSSYGFSTGATLPNGLGLMIGWLGAFVSVATSYFQYRASLPYEHHFTEADWKQSADGLTISIPLSQHKRRAGPGVGVLERTADGFAEVFCGSSVQGDGAILVSATSPFAGKIVVR